jgi:hypothetical protein
VHPLRCLLRGRLRRHLAPVEHIRAGEHRPRGPVAACHRHGSPAPQLAHHCRRSSAATACRRRRQGPRQLPESPRPQVAAPAPPLPPPDPAGEEKAADEIRLRAAVLTSSSAPRPLEEEATGVLRFRTTGLLCLVRRPLPSASALPLLSASSGGSASPQISSRSPPPRGDGGGCRRPGSAPTSSSTWACIRQ